MEARGDSRGEIEHAILAYLRAHIRGADITRTDDVFARGWVTSLFAIQLVTFLEDTFAIRFENEDLTLDNFRTVERMSALVAKARRG